MNRITINFVPCDPNPENGYNVKWRVFGSTDPFTDLGNFFSSPVTFDDETNPDGTQYEGEIRSDVGSGITCNEIYWYTQSESGDSGTITCDGVGGIDPMSGTGTVTTIGSIHRVTLNIHGTATNQNIARASDSDCWPACKLTGNGGVFDSSDNFLRNITLTYGVTGYIAIVGTDTIAAGEHIVAIFDDADCDLA